MSEKRLLLKNFSALSLAQLAIMALPFLTLPYLVRVLGVERFGLVAYAQATMMMFYVLADFGVSLYAPAEIAAKRLNPEKLRAYFWDVSFLRLAILLVFVAIAAVLVVVVPRFRQESMLFYGSMFYFISLILPPVWFLQGMEDMGLLAAFNLVSRSLGVGAVFLLVRTTADYWMVPFALAGLPAFLSIPFIGYVIRKHSLNQFVLEPSRILRQMRVFVGAFFSNLGLNLFATVNPVIIGSVAGDAAVGYYVGAQKIAQAAMLVLHAQINQAFYPFVCRKVQEGRENAARALGASFTVMVVAGLGVGLLLLLFAGPVVRLVLGAEMSMSVLPLQVLAMVVVVDALNNVFGVQGLLGYGRKREFTTIVTVACIVNVATCLVLAPVVGAVAGAVAWLAAVAVIFAATFFKVEKRFLGYVPKHLSLKVLAYVGVIAAVGTFMNMIGVNFCLGFALTVASGLLVIGVSRLLTLEHI